MVFKLGHLLNMEPSDTKPRCTRNAPGLLYLRRCSGRRATIGAEQKDTNDGVLLVDRGSLWPSPRLLT